MHLGGPRAHRVAVGSVLVWAALTIFAVVPGGSQPSHGSGSASSTARRAVAEAAADVQPRPSLQALLAADQPVAYWPLQDTSPAAPRDVVGGHDGRGSGSLSMRQVGQGPTMTSAGFDGSTAQITAAATGLAGKVASASVWLRLAPGGGGSVVDTGGLSILVAGGRAAGVSCAANGPCRAVVSRSRLDDGAWHQVALSVATGNATLFVDGAAEASGPSPGFDAAPLGGQVTIGRQLHGDLDNVALFSRPLGAASIAAQFGAGACPQAAGSPDTPAALTGSKAMPALPLRTSGRWIVDAHGRRVKFAGVNWYGAEQLDHVPGGLQCQSADAIAAHIAASGFDVVRLPWATDAWVGAAAHVPPVAVAGDPSLRGLDARAVFDAVIAALGRHGVMVVLDNHVGRPDWCCETNDGNALWWSSYDPAHPPRWQSRTWRGKVRLFWWGQQRWLAAWRGITARYAPGGPHPQPNVVAVDLRNEPRDDTRLGIRLGWGGRRLPPWQDWPRAAEKAGNLVLRTNPRLLVVVEGSTFGTDLQGVLARPVHLGLPNRLVYSAHDYAWLHANAASTRDDLGRRWGWLLIQKRWWTTPVLVGEFGSCRPEASTCADTAWFRAVRQYLADGDIDWTYWAINGTSGHGAAEPTTCAATPREAGCTEGYGLLDDAWSAYTSPGLSVGVASVTPATQGP